MLIVGAKGFAKEVLEICFQNNEIENLAFYDDVNKDIGSLLFHRFPILNSIEQAKHYFENIDRRFTIGIGNPKLRKKLVKKFTGIGGVLSSTISNNTHIGNFNVLIGEGANIFAGVKISNSVAIGKCPLIYYNTIITHDVVIGDFVELSPSVTILGRSRVNNNTQIGAGAIILPDLEIGKNTIIGAGAVVTTNIPDDCTAIGIPAKIIKKKIPI